MFCNAGINNYQTLIKSLKTLKILTAVRHTAPVFTHNSTFVSAIFILIVFLFFLIGLIVLIFKLCLGIGIMIYSFYFSKDFSCNMEHNKPVIG